MLWETIIGSPVIRESDTRNEKQPILHTLRAILLIDATRCFEKYFRRQVFGFFSIANLAIYVAVNQPDLLLIKSLKFLHIHRNSPGGKDNLICIGIFHCFP